MHWGHIESRSCDNSNNIKYVCPKCYLKHFIDFNSFNSYESPAIYVLVGSWCYRRWNWEANMFSELPAITGLLRGTNSDKLPTGPFTSGLKATLNAALPRSAVLWLQLYEQQLLVIFRAQESHLGHRGYQKISDR